MPSGSPPIANWPFLFAVVVKDCSLWLAAVTAAFLPGLPLVLTVPVMKAPLVIVTFFLVLPPLCTVTLMSVGAYFSVWYVSRWSTNCSQ